MRVSRAGQPGKVEKTTKLGQVKPGDVFRFFGTSFEEVLAGGESAPMFFMAVEASPKKVGSTTIVSIDGKSTQERDDDLPVFVHSAKLEVGETEMVVSP